MPSERLHIVARGSRLSRAQVSEFMLAVETSVPDTCRFSTTFLDTPGDADKSTPLTAPDLAPDFFTRSLDDALLGGRADLAVHSAKDLPYPLPAGLSVWCLTAASDTRDALVSRSGLTLPTLPPGARIGTSSAARQASLLEVRPDVMPLPIRGTIDERLAQLDEGRFDAVIVAACALHRLGLDARISEYLPFPTHPLQGHLAVVGRADDPRAALFSALDIRRRYGRVSLVGFGAGRAEWLTLAASRALHEADVVLYDDLIDAEYLRSLSAECIYVGKRAGAHSAEQPEIHALLYRHAVEGRRVVRLKGGDPMIFAHAREEIDFLRARLVEVDVFNGITAALAAAASTGIPLTHRGLSRSVAFALGHGGDVPTPTADTLVYYMGGRNLSHIAERLLTAGRAPSTPVCVALGVGFPDEKHLYSTLGRLRHTTLQTSLPALLLVGEVVRFGDAQPALPTLHTGTHARDAVPTDVHTPLIKITPRSCTPSEASLLTDVSSFDYLIFTSRHGADFFFKRLIDLHIDFRRLHGVQLLSVGPATSEVLHRYGFFSYLQSDTTSAEGILAYFADHVSTRSRVLLARGSRALASLRYTLALAHDVVDLHLYDTIPDPSARRVDLTPLGRVMFSSPSGVEAFVALYGALPSDLLLEARGRTTLAALQSRLSSRGR